MTDEKIKLPFYAQTSLFLLGIIALFTILYIGRGILIPLVFAIIIAIVLHPVVNFFVDKKINRIVAITITLLLTIIIIAAFGLLIYSQINRLSESLPALIEKFTEALNRAVIWVSGYLDINSQKIFAWITETKGEIMNSSGAAIGKTLVSIGGILIALFLVPVYVFFILLYQPLIIDFIHKLFVTNQQSKVNIIITRSKTVIQRYLVGLVMEAVIMAALNTTALLIIGIDYAFVLGILIAILNVIPYIGGVVGVALPVMIALATKSSAWYAVYVMAAYYVIQLIDNNYIVPVIVSSKVKINALFSLIVVFVGNALWGIPGMFLSIPILAIVKLILDNIEQLEPYGFLLGDTLPPLIKIKPIIKKIIKKK